jgi:hypothetical protein
LSLILSVQAIPVIFVICVEDQGVKAPRKSSNRQRPPQALSAAPSRRQGDKRAVGDAISRMLAASHARVGAAAVTAVSILHRQRQRRYRERQAAGDVMVTQRITPAESAKLLRHGYLRECELEDRQAISEALTALIADLIDK